jgi:diguanylate cyclase (GGDEF)-like protein
LVLLIRARTPGRDRASLIDATIIATGLGLLSWVFLMKPAATDSTLGVVGRVISIAYPAADVLLLALVARLLVGAGGHNTAFRLLAGSLLIMLAGDVGFAMLAQTDAFTPNNVINITWLLAYVLFGAAALHPSMAALSERAVEQPRRLTRRRLSLLTGVSLVAPILLLAQACGRSGIDAAAIGVGSIALFLLVVARMAGLIRQVELQAAQLETLAQHDPLTGAANRRAWDRTLPVEMDRAGRAGTPLVVALLDLDHFKAFNDQYGHQAGDQLLRSATEAWQSLLRSSDLLARYGGEEFAVLLPTSTLGQAVEIVDRLRVATPLAQTFSAGVALWRGDETADQLVARADKALYQAKQAGRNQVLPADSSQGPSRLDLGPARMARLAAADRPTT